MLASGSDVKIGSYEFMLSDADGPGHQYLPESLYSSAQDVQGIEGAKTANPNVLVWTLDDFAGGSETKFFDDRIADTYWYGKVNPRVRGAARPIPTTANTNVAQVTTLTASHEVFFTSIGGTLWMGCGRDLWYSTDNAATWTQWNATSLFGAGYIIRGMSHDGSRPWVCADDTTTRQVVRVDTTTTSTTAVANYTMTTNDNRTFGMGALEGKVYLWTGAHLIEYDSSATLPLTHRAGSSGVNKTNRAHTPHSAPPTGTYLTNFFAGITSTDTSVCYFTAGGGTTLVYEFKYNAATNVFAGRKIWGLPEGFDGRAMCHSMGVLYVLGSYGNDVALASYSLINREPQIVTYVGSAYGSDAAATLTPRFIAPSYGASVILGVDNGTTEYQFVYDAELDSLSELDQQTLSSVGTAKAAITNGGKRIIAEHLGTSTVLRTQRWSEDNAATTSGWTLITPAHHMRYPYDEKVLFTIQIMQDPAQASGTVAVEYQIDESGTWVSTDFASATMITTAGVKYTNFQISGPSSSVKFRILRLRLTGASGARMFNATVKAYINAYQEVWRLRLLIDDETAALNARPGSRTVSAETIRDYVRTLVTNKNVVAFLDGRRYVQQSDSTLGYSSHTVVLEFPPEAGIFTQRKATGLPNQDKLRGYCDVVLRSILG